VNLHVVHGGIGKQVAFTSILNKLSDKICIASPWGNVFLNHPMVESVYPDFGYGAYDMNKFFKSFENIIYTEPYYGPFLKGEMHLIEAYHEKLNLKCDGLYHTVTFSEEELHYYSKFIEELGDYILVQFNGSDVDFNKPLNELGARNVDINLAQQIINVLALDLNKKVIEVNNGQQQFKNTFTLRKQPEYREYLVMARYCQSFIGIDSCLNHMSAFKDNPKKGVVLWRDSEYGKLFEYSHNTNIYSSLPLQMKFNINEVIENVFSLCSNSQDRI